MLGKWEMMAVSEGFGVMAVHLGLFTALERKDAACFGHVAHAT
jgi:hypothetical protein